MKRIIMMFIRNFFRLPQMLIGLIKYSKNVDKYSDEEIYAHLRWIVSNANRGGNVEIVKSGMENIPKEDGFIFYPNHQGMYDVLALLDACDRPFSVVSKKEVQNVPLLKNVFVCMRALFIDREDIKQSLQVILDVIKQVKAGRNFVIFAEGTRSRKGNETLEFKGGSFKAATKTKCPIVPVALIDSFMPFDTGSIKTVKVQIHILPPMYYDEYKDMKTTEIAKEVRDRINKTIAEYSAN
ncbi:MAG: lysophospholipid acyltransferase family protein [Eubacteriales bacterium]|nr:lysophospholipid acyltransferase family protein [Eubacteriales bacterium]